MLIKWIKDTNNSVPAVLQTSYIESAPQFFQSPFPDETAEAFAEAQQKKSRLLLLSELVRAEVSFGSQEEELRANKI